MNNMTNIRFGVIVVASLIGLASATAATVQATPGKRATIGQHVAFTRGCAQGPIPWITILEKPANGSLTTDTGPVTMGGISVGGTSCIGHTTKGLYVYYTANPGFHGVEHVQYRVDFSLLGNSNRTVDIRVK